MWTKMLLIYSLTLVISSNLFHLTPITISQYTHDQHVYKHSMIDSGLMLKVSVGNPPRPFQVLVSLAKRKSWLWSSECLDCNQNLNKYNNNESSTYSNETSNPWSDTDYNIIGCYVSGKLALDEFHISGYDSEINALAEFIMVNRVQHCENLLYDGMLGLYTKGECLGLIESLWESGKIEEPIFSLFINLNPESDLKSSLQIGGSNLALYSSNPNDIFYTNVRENNNKWMPTSDFVELGHWKYNYTANLFLTSTLAGIEGELGFYFIMMSNLHQAGVDCSAFGNFEMKCEFDDLKNAPGLSFQFGQNALKLEPQDIWACEGKICEIKIKFTRGSEWGLGIVLLNRYYTIYNIVDNTVGFAPSIASKSGSF